MMLSDVRRAAGQYSMGPKGMGGPVGLRNVAAGVVSIVEK